MKALKTLLINRPYFCTTLLITCRRLPTHELLEIECPILSTHAVTQSVARMDISDTVYFLFVGLILCVCTFEDFSADNR